MHRLLALGDSYTIGEGVDASGRWPEQLAALLAARGQPVSAPCIVARTGWTTDELVAGIEAAAPAGPFELVTLLVGVNDQYRGRAVEAFRAGLAPLLRRAVDFAEGEARRVVMLSIPDWGVTPFAAGRDRAAVAAEIDRFNAVAREAARTAGVRWVDVTEISRTAGAALADDGLHPGAAQYARWAERVLPEALEALGAPTGLAR